MTAVLGIVAALEMEGRWILASEPLVEVSGGGEERARAAAHSLLERGASALVSWGVAGGLDPELEPGSVVLPDAVVHTDGSSQEAPGLCGHLNLTAGPRNATDHGAHGKERSASANRSGSC